MTVFEYWIGFALLIAATISVAVVFRILYIFFVQTAVPTEACSVAFILVMLPKHRIRVLVLTVMIIASATLTLLGVMICLFVTKTPVVFNFISMGTSATYLLLMVYIHTIKKYEVMSIDRHKQMAK